MMNIHQEEQQQSYTGYAETSQKPRYDYPPLNNNLRIPQPPGSHMDNRLYRSLYNSRRGNNMRHSLLDGNGVRTALQLRFGWLSGILFFLFSDGNRYVRFHALQSLLFFGSVNVFDILFIWNFAHFRHLAFVPFMPYLGGLSILFFLLLNFVAFVGWFVALFQAAGERTSSFRLSARLFPGYYNRGHLIW